MYGIECQHRKHRYRPDSLACTITVTDANGCIANLGGTVNSSGIVASIVSQTDATCSNGDDGSAARLPVPGGTAPRIPVDAER